MTARSSVVGSASSLVPTLTGARSAASRRRASGVTAGSCRHGAVRFLGGVTDDRSRGEGAVRRRLVVAAGERRAAESTGPGRVAPPAGAIARGQRDRPDEAALAPIPLA